MNKDSPLAAFKTIFFAFASLVALAPLAMDAYLPAFLSIAEYLSVEIVDVQYTLVLFLVGSTLGQFLGGPLSDAIGRLRVGFLGSMLFAATSFLIALTADQSIFYYARALQGFAAGSAGVVVYAIIAENYSGKAAANMVLRVTLVIMGIPLVAPLLGTALLKLEGWRAIFYFLGAVGCASSLTVFLNTPKKRLRPQDKVKRNLLTGVRNMLRNYRAVLAKPAGRIYLISMGMNISVYAVFATSASFAYMGFLGASLELFPFLLGANALSLVAGNRLGSVLMNTMEPQQVCVVGSTTMVIFCAGLVGYLLMFDATLPMVVLFVILIIGCIPMSGPIASAVFMQLYDKNAGTASAAMGVSRVLFAMIGAFLVTWLHNNTLYPMAALMLLVATAAMVAFRLGSKYISQTERR